MTRVHLHAAWFLLAVMFVTTPPLWLRMVVVVLCAAQFAFAGLSGRRDDQRRAASSTQPSITIVGRH